MWSGYKQENIYKLSALGWSKHSSCRNWATGQVISIKPSDLFTLMICRSSLDFSARRVAYASAPLFRKLHDKKQRGMRGQFRAPILKLMIWDSQRWCNVLPTLCHLHQHILKSITSLIAKTLPTLLWVADPTAMKDGHMKEERTPAVLCTSMRCDLFTLYYPFLTYGNYNTICRSNWPGHPFKVCDWHF